MISLVCTLVARRGVATLYFQVPRRLEGLRHLLPVLRLRHHALATEWPGRGGLLLLPPTLLLLPLLPYTKILLLPRSTSPGSTSLSWTRTRKIWRSPLDPSLSEMPSGIVWRRTLLIGGAPASPPLPLNLATIAPATSTVPNPAPPNQVTPPMLLLIIYVSRTEEDLEILMEFTHTLEAFSDMTQVCLLQLLQSLLLLLLLFLLLFLLLLLLLLLLPFAQAVYFSPTFFLLLLLLPFAQAVRSKMCAAMVFAVVDKAGTVVMNDGEVSICICICNCNCICICRSWTVGA